MPSTELVYRVLALGILVCVCSSTATAAVGIDRGTPDATTGCFPGVDSVDRGETVGDVVDVEMLLCFTGSVTVDGPGYRGEASLGDGNRSGTVTLHLDTGATDSDVFNVTSDTLDSVPMGATGDGSFGFGTYTVTVRDGSGDVVDAVSFELNESSPRTNASRDVSVYRVANGTFGSAEAVEDAISNGTLEPADDVAFGDVLAVAIDSGRLVETINATNGSSTAGFFAALDGDAEFRIIQTNPTPMKNRKIALLGSENVTVHSTEGTVYAVIETRNVTFQYREVHRHADLFGGERFAVQFGYDLPDDWDRGSVPSSPIIEFHPRSELPTEQPQTTVESSTTEQQPTTETSSTTDESTTTTQQDSDAPTSESSTTPVQSTTSTDTQRDDAGTTGVPGFTLLTALVALLVLVANQIRRT